MSTFTVSADWGVYPLAVLFTDTTPGAMSTGWDFGDGSTGAGNTVTHIFGTAGDFTVAMKNSEGTATKLITVVPPYTVSFGQNTISYPMRQVQDEGYASIPMRGLQNTYPSVWYDDGNYPLRTVSLWPVPAQAWAVELWLWEPLITYASLDEELNLPPGYERYLRYKLAAEIAPEFGKELPPAVAASLIEAQANVKRMNQKQPLAVPSAAGAAIVRRRQTQGWGTGSYVDFATGPFLPQRF